MLERDKDHPKIRLKGEENQGVRGMLSERERRDWLRRQAKMWAGLVVGVPTALVAISEAISKLLALVK